MPGWAGSQGKEDPSVATDGEHGARQGHGAGCPHGACGWHRGRAAASPSRTPPCAGPPGADLLLPALSPHFEVSANSEFAFPASTCTISCRLPGRSQARELCVSSPRHPSLVPSPVPVLSAKSHSVQSLSSKQRAASSSRSSRVYFFLCPAAASPAPGTNVPRGQLGAPEQPAAEREHRGTGKARSRCWGLRVMEEESISNYILIN